MARTKRKPTTEPPEQPVSPPKSKPRPKMKVTAEDLKMMTAAELAPPEKEIIQSDPNTARPRPSPHKNGTEYPTFAEKIAQQKAPRKRDPGEPFASFVSSDIRIEKDGYMWQVRSERELTGNEKDRLAASGFHAVDDDEKVWNAAESTLKARGTDINNVAFQLGKQRVAGMSR